MYPMFFSQNAVKNTKKEKLLKLQPNMAKRMNVLCSISSMNVKAFIITPSSELTDLMCRNGPSKEPSAAMVGPSLPDKKVTNISTARTKTKIFFLLESQSRSGTIARNGIEKRLMMLGTIWEKVLNLATRLPNTKELPNIGKKRQTLSIFLCRKVSISTNTS